ncbi:MAG: hypothetical protein KBE65_07140 [Phycisphaerae bacterium]|nr:hypothetical protein [Phycisphaerae bacterium]
MRSLVAQRGIADKDAMLCLEGHGDLVDAEGSEEAGSGPKEQKVRGLEGDWGRLGKSRIGPVFFNEISWFDFVEEWK